MANEEIIHTDEIADPSEDLSEELESSKDGIASTQELVHHPHLFGL
jgi:hypothetical protein